MGDLTSEGAGGCFAPATPYDLACEQCDAPPRVPCAKQPHHCGAYHGQRVWAWRDAWRAALLGALAARVGLGDEALPAWFQHPDDDADTVRELRAAGAQLVGTAAQAAAWYLWPTRDGGRVALFRQREEHEELGGAVWMYRPAADPGMMPPKGGH